jgi:hypothetical protein
MDQSLVPPEDLCFTALETDHLLPDDLCFTALEKEMILQITAVEFVMIAYFFNLLRMGSEIEMLCNAKCVYGIKSTFYKSLYLMYLTVTNNQRCIIEEHARLHGPSKTLVGMLAHVFQRTFENAEDLQRFLAGYLFEQKEAEAEDAEDGHKGGFVFLRRKMRPHDKEVVRQVTACECKLLVGYLKRIERLPAATAARLLAQNV